MSGVGDDVCDLASLPRTASFAIETACPNWSTSSAVVSPQQRIGYDTSSMSWIHAALAFIARVCGRGERDLQRRMVENRYAK